MFRDQKPCFNSCLGKSSRKVSIVNNKGVLKVDVSYRFVLIHFDNFVAI